MKTTRKLLGSICIALPVLFAASAQGQRSNDRFGQWDRNGDGKLTREELPARASKSFDAMDANGDHGVVPDELEAFIKSRVRSVDRGGVRPIGALAPTHADVHYGDHEKQAFDIWLAETKDGKPTPLVIYIHGGGFRGGDKKSVRDPIQSYLDRGISFASMNYRLSDTGPYPIMMHDAARGLQYIRSRADEWNLDAKRVACYGGSAGAGISLWLAFHDDLADPDSDDPVARQSTRILAAATSAGQSTYDMRTFREWFGVPDLAPHGALVDFYAIEKESDWDSERVKALMSDASPITHLSRDDVPVYMTYSDGKPVTKESSPSDWVHHKELGLRLQQAMRELGLECTVNFSGRREEKSEGLQAFLIRQVKGGDVAETVEVTKPAQSAEVARSVEPAATPQVERSGKRGKLKKAGERIAPAAREEFDKQTLDIGDVAPDFELRRRDGKGVVKLSEFRGKKPVVLVFGSITCPPFRQKIMGVKPLHEKYGEQAEFFMVYIREAHPQSVIEVEEHGKKTLKTFSQTVDFSQRMENAQSCSSLLDLPFPIIVDGDDNRVKKAYAGFPIRLIVVDGEGKIAFDGGQGPKGFEPDKLGEWLAKNL